MQRILIAIKKIPPLFGILPGLIWLPVICALVYCAWTDTLHSGLTALLTISAAGTSLLVAAVLYHYHKPLSRILSRRSQDPTLSGPALLEAVFQEQEKLLQQQEALISSCTARDALDYADLPPSFQTLLTAFREQLQRDDQSVLSSTLQQLEEALSLLDAATQRQLCLHVLSAYLQSPVAQTLQAATGAEAATATNQQLFRMIRHAITNLSMLAPEAEQGTPSEIQDVLLDYVDQNCLDSSLCLNSAADYLNTSIYTVSRIFKDATGVGFKEYINSKRLQYACHLLETTKITVSAVAAASGFENSTYFTTVFKNEYGVPPSKYRAAAQRQPTSP